jgi:glycogen synthase
LPWSSPTLVVAHSCVFSWWDAVRGNTPPAEWQRYKREVTSGLQAAHFVVAPSNMMLNAIQQHYGKVHESRVIPNGRNVKSFRPAPKQNFILCAGRLWDAGKNIARVDQIASELPWPVFVAGDSVGPQQSRQEPRQKDRCHLLGLLDDATLREWFGSAAIYALPALYEPFGYTPLEAGLSQCALVLGDIDSLRENWEGAAVFVDPHDSQELKNAIVGLIDNDAYRMQMSRLARLRALEFSTQRMANDYLAVYSDLLTRFRRLRREERLVQCA